MSAFLSLGYASPKRSKYHLWWCMARGPMLAQVNSQKASAGHVELASAKPAHSTISPK